MKSYKSGINLYHTHCPFKRPYFNYGKVHSLNIGIYMLFEMLPFCRKYKKNRTMTVIYTGDQNYKPVPTSRLKGKWLEEYGFEIGDKAVVECQEGKLLITKVESKLSFN